MKMEHPLHPRLTLDVGQVNINLKVLSTVSCKSLHDLSLLSKNRTSTWILVTSSVEVGQKRLVRIFSTPDAIA